MREHVKADEPFVREDVAGRRGARALPREDQPYKVELIEDLVRNEGVETVSLYTNGPFTDLCRGPHGPATKRIKAFKLQSVAGAYWRGDASRTMLTRIYGTAFLSKEELEPSTSSASRRRGRATTASSAASSACSRFSPVAPGAAFWLPNGTRVFNELVALTREMGASAATPRSRRRRSSTASCGRPRATGASTARTCSSPRPRTAQMAIKPMNCPGHAHLFVAAARTPTATCRSATPSPACCTATSRRGTLHGLLRVRHFAQDDAHIFCTEEQVAGGGRRLPRLRVRDATDVRLRACTLELSTRPREADRQRRDVGPRRGRAARRRSRAAGSRTSVNEGDGAFYGPKIDFHVKDSLGRSLAARHGAARLLDARALRPRLHGRRRRRAPAGDDPPRRCSAPSSASSAILIEHYAGELPAVAGAGAGDRAADRRPPRRLRRRGARRRCARPGVRVEVDDRTESVGRKIRDAELRKIPLHARRRRPRGGDGHRGRAPSTARATRAGRRAGRAIAEQRRCARRVSDASALRSRYTRPRDDHPRTARAAPLDARHAAS